MQRSLLVSKITAYPLPRVIAAVMLLTAAGVLGRVALQYVPSVEPLTPMAVLIGLLFGPFAGFASGASGFYASNFLVWGGQGPWTVLQCAGAGLAGALGGLAGKGNRSPLAAVAATICGVLLYETVVTLGSAALVSLSAPFAFLYVLTSLPFSFVHLTSSTGFMLAFYACKDDVRKMAGGELIEQEVVGFRSDTRRHGGSDHKLVSVGRTRRWFRYRSR